MFKNKKSKLIIVFSIIFIIISYFSLTIAIEKEKFKMFFSFLDPKQKLIIKKYFFPFKYVSDLEIAVNEKQKKIYQREGMIRNFKTNKVKLLLELETITKITSKDIPLTKKTSLKLSNDKVLEKYKFEGGFYYGINLAEPGSGYIDFYENNIFVLSGRGVLAYRKNLNDDGVNFKQIKNNLDDFISIKQYEKHEWFS
jgi:hypothetical protein